jgi:molybdopterin molybdotransferase
MITVEEADTIISANIKEFPSVRIPLEEAFGMILREDLTADRDLPPFHRVMMDGIAVHVSSCLAGHNNFPIEGIQKAGDPALTLKDSSSCIEVMTGAVLPAGCDCVIPVESVEIVNGKAQVNNECKPSLMMNVHAQGSDHESGAKLVLKGARLLSPQVAVAAAVGKTKVLVSQPPKIAVIGTGDELVGIDQKPRAFQIRQSNSFALQAALQLQGYDLVTRFHMKDDKQAMRKQLSQILGDFDIVVLSGGVSMGKFDHVPEVLKDIGVEVLFHRVKQRPGKPFWFGKSKEGKPVFALPGNPVATQIGAYRYVLPYLGRAAGALEAFREYAVLDEDVEIKTALTFFLPVKIESGKDGRLAARPVFPSGSGDYASLVSSDGFIELPADTFQFAKGTTGRLYRWKF